MEKTANILIIDDDPDFVEAIKAILENKSYNVSAAYDKNEGIKKINSEKPDLILLDIMMEKLDDGFTICYELKHNPELKKIPVLAISAITDETGLKFSIETDGEYFEADDYIVKPVRADDLLERIEKLLKK
ncbi:MAG: response regulator [Actinobacteria bacterium]|nr:response regulator [Actinomycetota bacterium]